MRDQARRGPCREQILLNDEFAGLRRPRELVIRDKLVHEPPDLPMPAPALKDTALLEKHGHPRRQVRQQRQAHPLQQAQRAPQRRDEFIPRQRCVGLGEGLLLVRQEGASRQRAVGPGPAHVPLQVAEGAVVRPGDGGHIVGRNRHAHSVRRLAQEGALGFVAGLEHLVALEGRPESVAIATHVLPVRMLLARCREDVDLALPELAIDLVEETVQPVKERLLPRLGLSLASARDVQVIEDEEHVARLA